MIIVISEGKTRSVVKENWMNSITLESVGGRKLLVTVGKDFIK